MKNKITHWKIIRPELYDGAAEALLKLSADAGVSYTEYVNTLVMLDWNSKYENITFPDVNGNVQQIECTFVQDKQ